MEKLKQIEQSIEQARRELLKLTRDSDSKSLSSPNIVRLSMELDKLIIEYYALIKSTKVI